MSLGFPTWRPDMFPGLFCHATSRQLYNFSPWNPLQQPFPPTGAADFEAACRACEHHATLDQASWLTVQNALHYDKSPDGPRGRALLTDLPVLNLRKGDRLEPGLGLLDAAAFDAIAAFPREVLF